MKSCHKPRVPVPVIVLCVCAVKSGHPRHIDRPGVHGGGSCRHGCLCTEPVRDSDGGCCSPAPSRLGAWCLWFLLHLTSCATRPAARRENHGLFLNSLAPNFISSELGSLGVGASSKQVPVGGQLEQSL